MALAIGCGTPSGVGAGGEKRMNRLDQAGLQKQVESRLSGLDGVALAEGRSLAAELVADWAREADGDPDVEAINKVQRDDLDAALADKTGGARLTALRVHTLERLVRHLGGKTYLLGCARIDGKVTPEAAHDQGKQLLTQVEALTARAKAVGDADGEARIRRALEDAFMEALYAIEGQAMSLRLGRYAQSHGVQK
jgi:hypothetical protein